MKTLIDFATAPVFAVPIIDAAGREILREGMLVEGPQGWGEFSPPPDADTPALSRWLTAAIEPGTVGWPDAVRGRISVSVPVPAVPAARAHEIVASAGCRTADVQVGAHPGSLGDDVERVAAVRDALGPDGAIRCNANGQWDIDDAVQAIDALHKAASGLEYVERPCGNPRDTAAVHNRTDVRIAVHVAPAHTTSLTGIADVAILQWGPLGGVRRALRAAEACELPCVVSSAMETSVGLAGAVALAGVLPELPFACALGTRLSMAGDLVSASRSLVPVDGLLPVAPMAPAPDPVLVAHFRLADPARVRWWRDLLRAAEDAA